MPRQAAPDRAAPGQRVTRTGGREVIESMCRCLPNRADFETTMLGLWGWTR
jgi:hypothetical protein